MKGFIQLCAVGYQTPAFVSLVSLTKNSVTRLENPNDLIIGKELQAGNQAESKLHELGKTPINFENLRQLIVNYPNKDDAEIYCQVLNLGLK